MSEWTEAEQDRITSQEWRQQEETEKRQRQEDIEQAWSRLMADYKDCKGSFRGAWATDDDIKLLKWAIGVE